MLHLADLYFSFRAAAKLISAKPRASVIPDVITDTSTSPGLTNEMGIMEKKQQSQGMGKYFRATMVRTTDTISVPIFGNRLCFERFFSKSSVA